MKELFRSIVLLLLADDIGFFGSFTSLLGTHAPFTFCAASLLMKIDKAMKLRSENKNEPKK